MRSHTRGVHRILSGPCMGSPCPLYPLPTYQKDANVIMILEGSYNHLTLQAWDAINWIIKVVQ